MEFASTHIYAYDEESDEEDLDEKDFKEQANPLYMTFGEERSVSGPQGAAAAQLPDVVYDNAGRRPPQDNAGRRPPQESAQVNRLPDGIYDNSGRLPQDKARNEDAVIYDNRPEPSLPSAKTEDVYASPYDYPRKAPLYQDVDLTAGRPPPPSNPPPLPPDNKKVAIRGEYSSVIEAAKPPSKKIRRADTNVIAVHFDKLVKASSLHANQPIICSNCGAVFSRLSVVTDQIWRCEFCDERKNIKVSLEDIQQKEDTTFIIQPPSERGDDKALIFCVDVSGSMSVTTEVSGEVLDHQRPNDMTAALQAYQEEMAGSNLYGTTPAGATEKKVSYISRLQAMQSAVDQQLEAMQSTAGNKRVGLVAFNDLVTIIGDGTDYPMPLEGASLTDKDTVISLGVSIPLPQPLSEVRRCLADKIFSLVEGGQTALGPALLLSTAIASQKAGSKVIICTDGKANVGLGNLGDDDEAYEQAVTFYDEVGDYARDAGVSVSVVTMEGEDSRAIELGNVADKTGGQVTIVDPLKFGEGLANILEDNILATNVSVKLVLQNGLYIKDEHNDQTRSVAVRTIGNVSKESETTFEFGVRIKEVLYDNFGGALVEVQNTEDPVYDTTKTQAMNSIEGLERLPFQLQVQYTDVKGAQYLRVITLDKPVTRDRKFAEQHANVAVIGTHAAQSAAKLAVEGNYKEAQINALVTQRLVERHVQSQGAEGDEDIYSTFIATMAPIHNELQKAQTLERSTHGHSLSDVEEDEEEGLENAIYEPGEFIERKKRAMTKKAKQRRKKISDNQANLFYKMKNATSKMFHPQGKSSYAMHTEDE